MAVSEQSNEESELKSQTMLLNSSLYKSQLEDYDDQQNNIVPNSSAIENA